MLKCTLSPRACRNVLQQKQSRATDPELWRADPGGKPAPGRSHRVDRLGELRQPARCWKRRARSSPTSTPKAIRASATTAAASSSTWPKRSPSSARSSCSAPTTPTCSRTPVRRRTRRCTWRCCKPGDTILGMSLAHGGHLTHGASVNISGKLYNAVAYGLNANEDDRLRRGRAAGARAQAAS